ACAGASPKITNSNGTRFLSTALSPNVTLANPNMFAFRLLLVNPVSAYHRYRCRLWTHGGQQITLQRTWRKLTRTQGENANSTLKGPGQYSNSSCCEINDDSIWWAEGQ
ncbi:hypothetical protein ANANG_G00038130, partial [Anguilla anguilla]